MSLTVLPRAAVLNFLFASVLAGLAAVVPEGFSEGLAWGCLATFYAYFLASVRRPLRIWKDTFTYIKMDTLFLLFSGLILFLPYQVDLLRDGHLSGGRHFPFDHYVGYANTALLASLSGMVAFTAGMQHGRFIRPLPVTELHSRLPGFGIFAGGILGKV